jgi:uncharacterized membrane protein
MREGDPHRMGEASYRSVVKAVTWRTLAFTDTALLSFLFTGRIEQALAIGAVELLTKSLLYYVHERGWLRIAAWRDGIVPGDVPTTRESAWFAAFKALTWRVMGSIDTFIIAFVITGSLGTSASIGLTELATKIVLYYLHERIWLRVRWGTKDPRTEHKEVKR